MAKHRRPEEEDVQRDALTEKGSPMQRYYKAVIAVLGALAAALVAVQADPAVVAVLPADVQGWLAVTLLPALTGLITWLKRNEPTVAEAEEALARARARARV